MCLFLPSGRSDKASTAAIQFVSTLATAMSSSRRSAFERDDPPTIRERAPRRLPWGTGNRRAGAKQISDNTFHTSRTAISGPLLVEMLAPLGRRERSDAGRFAAASVMIGRSRAPCLPLALGGGALSRTGRKQEALPDEPLGTARTIVQVPSPTARGTHAVTPGQFSAKWRASELKESAATHSYFNDLCQMLGELTSTDADPAGDWYCFERGARKDTGGDGFPARVREAHVGEPPEGDLAHLAPHAGLDHEGPCGRRVDPQPEASRLECAGMRIGNRCNLWFSWRSDVDIRSPRPSWCRRGAGPWGRKSKRGGGVSTASAIVATCLHDPEP